jgi:hypothetical protein
MISDPCSLIFDLQSMSREQRALNSQQIAESKEQRAMIVSRRTPHAARYSLISIDFGLYLCCFYVSLDGPSHARLLAAFRSS